MWGGISRWWWKARGLGMLIRLGIRRGVWNGRLR
jgi:hypothetical protein